MAKKKQIEEPAKPSTFISDMTPVEPVLSSPSDSSTLIPTLDALVGRSYEIVGKGSPDEDGGVVYHVSIDGEIKSFYARA